MENVNIRFTKDVLIAFTDPIYHDQSVFGFMSGQEFKMGKFDGSNENVTGFMFEGKLGYIDNSEFEEVI